MPITTKYVLTASMDIEPDKEALFNEVYDTEHVPAILKVPGVLAVTRLKNEPLTLGVGGEVRTIVMEGEPVYSSIYEIENLDVMISDAWAEAVESGRWPEQVRPYTKNRRHTLHKVTSRSP